MLYKNLKNIKNIHKIIFLETKNCHRIFVQDYILENKYYMRDFYKIIYILDGSATIDDEGEKTNLFKGDMYMVRPNSYHRSLKLKHNKPLILVFELDLENLSKIHNFDKNKLFFGKVNYKHNIMQITSILRIFLKDRLVPSYSKIDILDNLITLLQILTVDIDLPQKKNDFSNVQSIVKLITEELPKRILNNKEITLKALSKEYNVSYHYLSKQFKDFTGQTYNEYLLELQMSIFISFFYKNPNESISNLAYMTGYKSLSSFNKDFKRFFNITPTELKTSYRDLLLLKKNIYKHPVVIDFLNSIDILNIDSKSSEIDLDFVGIRVFFQNGNSYDAIYKSYRKMLHKLINTKNAKLNIIYSIEDYIFLININDEKNENIILSFINKVLNICRQNNITVSITLK